MQNLQTYVLLPNKLPLTCFGNILPETGNLVGFFVGMGPDVDFKGGNLTETPVTQITFVWFLAGVDSKFHFFLDFFRTAVTSGRSVELAKSE
ncbi:unnamed protein product [Allacma fusca]|uniref:Uncharacterized protein n=1 Tax=Allacma fusca TaxID=39272 RepID=A0A8J2JYF5_9HEXA|nr:unnamed protein product [Allacma fusca]